VDHAATLQRSYAGVTELVTGLDRRDLLRPTRCFGWLVADVLFHLLCDAQRALAALASSAPGPPDRDFASYWRGFEGPPDPVLGMWWVRRSASAFVDGTGLVRLWVETAPAAAQAARAADPAGFVTTQGHVLAVPDLLATLVTEAVIHHVDMTVDLPAAPAPPAAGLTVATATLDALGGHPLPGWTPQQYLLKGTGRVPLTDAERADLGHAADRFPLLS